VIVLDHKALASSKPGIYERDYLKFYLSVTSQKAIVSNRVWESFRKNIISKNGPDMAQEIIATYRGIVQPETVFFDDNFEEKQPEKVYTEEELIESTKDLLDRYEYRVRYFICGGNKPDYPNNIYVLEVEEFYYHCMGELGLVEEYQKLTGKT